MKKITVKLCIIFILILSFSFNSFAELVNTQGNDYFTQNSIPTGKTGQNMGVSFEYQSDFDLDHIYVGIAYDDMINSSSDSLSPDANAFPFEASTQSLKVRDMGKFKSGQKKHFSINAKVRRDIPEGYYGVKLYACTNDDGSGVIAEEYVNVWIKKSSTNETTDETEVKSVSFVLGEDQQTPYGKYPDIMNFTLNLRNRGQITAMDVTASIVMDPDSTKYPFEINEANYDIHFDRIAYDETVSLTYSMAIRSDVYSGYYPIKMNITYRESSEGELKTAEAEFYVHVINKEKETEETTYADFNANDRTKARIVVDSYHTVPEQVYAGDEFELVVVMKNASDTVSASNLLFTFTPEKVSDSAVFSTSNGSDSIVVNSLNSGQTTQLSIHFVAKAGIDQRSYSMTIKEKYDSPEFKNAEESVDIDIPVKQVARLNTGTMDIMPDMINVGDESNVMFPINNTGKVILYNVTAKFNSDSIADAEAYVGNIKPGEAGNVDVMLKGENPTIDDGKIKVTISYEDENGNVSTVDKDLILTVNENADQTDETGESFTYEDYEEPKKPFYKNPLFIILIVVVLASIAVLIMRTKKKKRELTEALEESAETDEKHEDK